MYDGINIEISIEYTGRNKIRHIKIDCIDYITSNKNECVMKLNNGQVHYCIETEEEMKNRVKKARRLKSKLEKIL